MEHNKFLHFGTELSCKNHGSFQKCNTLIRTHRLKTTSKYKITFVPTSIIGGRHDKKWKIKVSKRLSIVSFD